MNAGDAAEARKENAPPTVWWDGAAVGTRRLVRTAVWLVCFGGSGHYPGMRKPDTSYPGGVAEVETRRWKWHGFTFPSKRVVGAAAQFNSSVSIVPPHHRAGEIDAGRRRHDGYTAKG